MTNYSIKKELLHSIYEHTLTESIPSSLKTRLLGFKESIIDPLKQKPYDMSLENSVMLGSVLNKSDNITYKLDKDSIEYISEFSKFVDLDQGEACSNLYKGLQSSGQFFTNKYSSAEDNYFNEREVNIRLSIQAMGCLDDTPKDPTFQELISNNFHNKLKAHIETSFASSLRFSDQLELSGKFNKEVNMLCKLYNKSICYMIQNIKGVETKERVNTALTDVLNLLMKLNRVQTDHCIKYRLEEEYANGLITPGHFQLIQSFVVLFDYSLQSNILEVNIGDLILKIGTPLKQFVLLLTSKSILLWEKNESPIVRSTVGALKKEIFKSLENKDFFFVLFTQLTNLHYDGTELAQIIPAVEESFLNLLKISNLSRNLKENLIQTQNDLYLVSNGYATNSETEHFFRLIEFIEKHNTININNKNSFLLNNQLLLILSSMANVINISNYNINQFSKTVLFIYKKAAKYGLENKISIILENSGGINSNNILVTVIEALKLFKNERPNIEEELTLNSVLRLVQCFPDLMVSDADLIQVIISLLSYEGFSSIIRAELLNILHQMTLLSTERATQIWCFIPQFLAMVFIDYKEIQSKDNNYILSVSFLRLLKSISKGRNMLSFFGTVVEFISMILNNQNVKNSSGRKLLTETCLFISDNIFLNLLKQQSLINETTLCIILNKLYKLYNSSTSLMSEINKKVENRSPLRMASSSNAYLLKVNTYKPLRLIEASVKCLYITLFNLPNTEEKIHSFVEDNKDSVIGLLEGFPFYAFKLLNLLMQTEPFLIINQLILKSNANKISSILYKHIEREEVLKIITIIFQTLYKVKNNTSSQPVISVFINEFTNKENLILLLRIINNEKSKNENVNLALECLRSILYLGLKNSLCSFELCVKELNNFIIVEEAGENELRISRSINEPVITNKNKLVTDSKKLAVKCLTLVFDTTKNWAILNSKELGFMKRSFICDVLNSYFISFLEKENLAPSFELINELMCVYLKFQTLTKVNAVFDSEMTSRVLECLSIYRNNLKEFENLLCFIELTKHILLDKETLISQIIRISTKSESSHLKKIVYDKVSSMLDFEHITNEHYIDKWNFIGNLELISQIVREVNLLLNSIKIEQIISEQKNNLYLNHQNNDSGKKRINEILSCLKMLNFSVYLLNTNKASEEEKLKATLNGLHVDVLIRLILDDHNDFNLNVRLLEGTETLFANIAIKMKHNVQEFLECLIDTCSVYDIITQVLEKHSESIEETFLRRVETFQVVIPLLKLLVGLPVSLATPINLFKTTIKILETEYFETLNHLYLYSKGKIKKNEEVINISLLCLEMSVINNILEGKAAMKIENIFTYKRDFVERKNIELELNDLVQFADRLKFQNREVNYSNRVIKFVNFVEELNKS